MNFKGARFDPDPSPGPGTKAYVYHDPRIVLAVNVALATGRPLLVTGVPGAGKSTLASDIARRLGWAYIATTITSRTRLEDLTARSDAVRRLSDAQLRLDVHDVNRYLVPGILWWAFDPTSAAAMPMAADPREDATNSRDGTVILLDEIDKAEPDLPNDLLGPLDGFTLRVPGWRQITARSPVLAIITSNGERAMPPAFLRRCVVLELDDDDPTFFALVATSHFGERTDTLYDDIARRTIHLGTQARLARTRKPSMAEYLDTVLACITYSERPPSTGGEPGSDLWDAIEEAALRKTRSGSRLSPSG